MRVAKAVALGLVGSASAAAVIISVPAASAATPFVQGTAAGVAQALQIAPRTGGFAYTMSMGNAIAQYRGTLAQAESQLLDLGLIGTSLTSEQCDGSKPTVNNDQLPQPLIVESDRGNQSKTHDYAGSSQGGLLAAGGHESVTATTVPAATASFQGGALGVPGVFEVDGMSATSGARLIAGQARIATADATVGQLSLLGGAVVLHNMHWAAAVRTGSHPSSSGTFTIGDATLAGHAVPVTPGGADAVLAAVNKALATTGLHLTVPTPTKRSDGTLLIPPMSLGIDDSKAGATLIDPVTTASQPIQQRIAQTLLSLNCKFGTPLLLKDIGLGTIDGTGGFDLKFGGVSAGTTAIAYTNPFGNVQFGTSAGSLGVGSGGTPAAGGVAPAVGGSVPAGAGSLGSAPGSAPQLAGQSKVAESCATTSSAHWPSCSNGAALVAGLLGLAAVGGIGGADWLMTRRRRRLPQLDL